jgi:ankyrin repeat protein
MNSEIGIREAMGKLSNDTLQGLYNETFQRIHEDKYAHAFVMNAFTLLLYLREPLSVDAFLEAIARMNAEKPVKLPPDDLLRLCLGLVVLDPYLNIFRFVHTSCQDFMESLPEFEKIQANALIASSCLNICMYGIPTNMTQISEPTETFYQYGTVYWIEHTRVVFRHQVRHDLNSLIENFLFDDDFAEWLDEVTEFSEHMPRHHPLKRALSAVKNPTGTPLFLASAFGLTNILDKLAEDDDFDWNQKSDTGHTAIYLASVFGEQQAAQFLIEHSADVNATGGRFGNPLQAACFEGHLDIARFLIDKGADPKNSGKFTTALEAAMMGGNEAITLSILQNSFQICNQETYSAVVRGAAQAGHAQVLQYVEETYLSSFGPASRPEAIESAIVKGKIRTLERLLKVPATVLPSDSVSIAVLSRQRDMTSHLLQKGANIEAQGQFGTPLRTAVIMEWEEMAFELLQAGANPNTSSPFGDALQAAAIRGHVSMARRLLKEGANPNNTGGYYGNALQAAAYYGHADIVKVLLDAGALVHSIGFAKDALHAAVEGGHEQIVRLFLDKGFRFRHPEPPTRFASRAMRSSFEDY